MKFKQITLLLLFITALTFIFEWIFIYSETSSPEWSLYTQFPIGLPRILLPSESDDATLHMNRLNYVQFGSFIAIPNFYMKRGRYPLDRETELVTLCSVSTTDNLSQAQTLATNYKSGPVSLAIYIDADIHWHSMDTQSYLSSVFDQYFGNITSAYGLFIGLVYVDTFSDFWLNYLRFDDSTPIFWKLPINAMRNLAEYQVQTKWLLTVDIDFELFSSTLNDPLFMNRTMNEDLYEDHMILVVPSFATVPRYVNSQELDWNALSKSELRSLIPKYIVPYFSGSVYQNCTNYAYWYETETDYKLDVQNCRKHYDPSFVIKTKVSRKYPWDSNFTGRHLDRVQRVQMLRYYNFTAAVKSDLFTIHVNRGHTYNYDKSRNYLTLNAELLRKAFYA